jgi:hypothetical protein
MTILTINIPDSNKSIISDISALVKKAGLDIYISSDDDLTNEEFELLAESYKEALLIKDGRIKAIPASELWND